MSIGVYGANGFQGKLVAAELARRGIDVVLMGRSPERLRTAAEQIEVPDATIRAAALDDPGRLAASLLGCQALINCAGPFTRSGDVLARAAITAGCHYVDTSGEQLHIKQIFDTLAIEAERAGVTIVPATTDGGVPGDLIAHLLAEHVEPVDEITTAHRIVGGGISRGSVRSLIETIETIRSGGLVYEDGDWRPGTSTRRRAMMFPGSSEEVPVMGFALQEVVTVPRHVRVRRVEAFAEAALADRLTSPISPALIERMPEGPTDDSRSAQRFTIVVDAVGRDGRAGRGVVSGSDTYGTTAVIAVEGARRLAAGGAKPGVLAPAQAFDPADFLDLLAPHGIDWNIDLHGNA